MTLVEKVYMPSCILLQCMMPNSGRRSERSDYRSKRSDYYTLELL